MKLRAQIEALRGYYLPKHKSTVFVKRKEVLAALDAEQDMCVNCRFYQGANFCADCGRPTGRSGR